ncbi:MAG: hypothetical protein H7Z12_08570 [Rhodospirillaceae bacterium]|nr:hypothetical protein [Rhodospirillales bacterium]
MNAVDSRNEIRVRVLAAIKNALPTKEIVPETKFDDFGIESLEAMSMIFMVEEELDIDLTDIPSGAIQSVEDVVTAVMDRMKCGEPGTQ